MPLHVYAACWHKLVLHSRRGNEASVSKFMCLPRYASLARKIVNKPVPARSPAAVLREEARALRADAGAVSPHWCSGFWVVNASVNDFVFT